MVEELIREWIKSLSSEAPADRKMFALDYLMVYSHRFTDQDLSTLFPPLVALLQDGNKAVSESASMLTRQLLERPILEKIPGTVVREVISKSIGNLEHEDPNVRSLASSLLLHQGIAERLSPADFEKIIRLLDHENVNVRNDASFLVSDERLLGKIPETLLQELASETIQSLINGDLSVIEKYRPLLPGIVQRIPENVSQDLSTPQAYRIVEGLFRAANNTPSDSDLDGAFFTPDGLLMNGTPLRADPEVIEAIKRFVNHAEFGREELASIIGHASNLGLYRIDDSLDIFDSVLDRLPNRITRSPMEQSVYDFLNSLGYWGFQNKITKYLLGKAEAGRLRMDDLEKMIRKMARGKIAEVLPNISKKKPRTEQEKAVLAEAKEGAEARLRESARTVLEHVAGESRLDPLRTLKMIDWNFTWDQPMHDLADRILVKHGDNAGVKRRIEKMRRPV